MEIYRPGSGPLRRSGSSRQDDDDEKRSVFTGFVRDLDSSKKSDFIPNKHFENPNRKKENFPRGQSKTNGFAADNYSTFNLRRKQQKKTQPFYEPPNEWNSDKRPDRPRVNFVNPDDSKGDDDENWRTHKAPKVVSVPKVVKKVDENPVPSKIIVPIENIPSMVIHARINTAPVQNIPEKVPVYGNRKRKEKKVPNKVIPSSVLIAYEKKAPRFRKKFCEENHVTLEEVELYLTNGIPQDDNKQHSSYHSRSQTLPPRTGKGRFNEPPQRHHEQIFYRTNTNQLPPKTEVKRVQSTANSSTESSRRGVDFDFPTKIYNSNQESVTVDSNKRDDTEDNVSINVKQSIESAVLLPSGTIVSLTLFYLSYTAQLIYYFGYFNL